MIDEKKLIESFRASLNTGRDCFPVDLIVECIEAQPKVGEWIPCSERLPEYSDDLVLVQVSGKPHMNITLLDALCLANYSEDEGWMLELYPEWKTPDVIAWMPLPAPYRPEIGEMRRELFFRN